MKNICAMCVRLFIFYSYELLSFKKKIKKAKGQNASSKIRKGLVSFFLFFLLLMTFQRVMVVQIVLCAWVCQYLDLFNRSYFFKFLPEMSSGKERNFLLLLPKNVLLLNISEVDIETEEQ